MQQKMRKYNKIWQDTLLDFMTTNKFSKEYDIIPHNTTKYDTVLRNTPAYDILQQDM